MTEAPRPSRGGIGNLIGGFVAGLYSVPEGIGYASLPGVSPMLGIYGHLAQLGSENVLPPNPHPGAAFDASLQRGPELLQVLRASTTST